MKIAQSIFFVLAYFVSFGQSGTISGKILTSEGNDIKSILQITINPSNQKVNTTNYGEFSFDNISLSPRFLLSEHKRTRLIITGNMDLALQHYEKYLTFESVFLPFSRFSHIWCFFKIRHGINIYIIG